MSKKINILGRRFGKLLVLKECKERDKFGNKIYKCLCDCGNITYIKSPSLITHNTRSCGCLRGVNHGKRDTKLYYIWCNIKQRCYNKNNNRYQDYGGRGIVVCDAWKHDFMNFYEWAMTHGYDDNLTIDRIDNNKGYNPDNCRWVNKKTQNNNKRNNVLLTYNGKTQTITQWAEELCIKSGTIRMRHRRGWSDKECLLGKEV